MKHALLPALAALAALGLAALPHAAHAQSLTLNSGDAVTVSGAGTVGTIGGKPVANTTTSYDTSDGSLSAVQTNGTSAFTLATGGTINAGQFGVGLFANGSSTVTISGGTFTAGSGGNGLFATGSSTVTVTGGSINAGQFGTGLFADGSSTINLFSLGDTPFLVNNVSMNNTTLAHYTSGTNTISGTLLDGEPFSTNFINNATINLNVGTPPASAPEPSPFAAFAIGLLGLGVLTVKARRRRAA